MQNIQQRFDCFLIFCFSNFLGELLLIDRIGNEHLNESEHVKQDDLFLGVEVLKNDIETLLGEKDLLDVWWVVAEIDEGARS